MAATTRATGIVRVPGGLTSLATRSLYYVGRQGPRRSGVVRSRGARLGVELPAPVAVCEDPRLSIGEEGPLPVDLVLPDRYVFRWMP